MAYEKFALIKFHFNWLNSLRYIYKPLKSIANRSKGNPHLFLTPSFPVTLFQKSEVEAALMLFS